LGLIRPKEKFLGLGLDIRVAVAAGLSLCLSFWCRRFSSCGGVSACGLRPAGDACRSFMHIMSP